MPLDRSESSAVIPSGVRDLSLAELITLRNLCDQSFDCEIELVRLPTQSSPPRDFTVHVARPTRSIPRIRSE